MKSDLLDNLKNTIVTEVATNEQSFKEELKENKIVVTILKGPEVNVKEIKVSTKIPKPRKPISKEEAEKIKEAKRVLKTNLDALNLFVLLRRLHEEIKRVNKSEVSSVGAGMLYDASKQVAQELNEMVILIEKK